MCGNAFIGTLTASRYLRLSVSVATQKDEAASSPLSMLSSLLRPYMLSYSLHCKQMGVLTTTQLLIFGKSLNMNNMI